MDRRIIVLACLAASGLSPGGVFAASQDNDVEWDGIFSDTTGNFVSPMEFDAGETITVSLRAKAGDLTAVTFRSWFSGPDREQRLPMTLASTSSGFDTWSVTFTVPPTTTDVYYRFEVIDGTDTDYYDAGAPSDPWYVRGMSDDYRGEDYNFHLVPGLHTPAWSKGAVFYQVFPDRFYDGDTSNDSLLPDDCFWYLDYAPARWGAAECQEYEVPAPPDGWSKWCELHDDWNETPNQGPCDFYGGDLAGIQAKLDYIASMHVTAIYLNPIFRSMSNHKYDTMDYTQVDPRFGSNADLGSLSSAAAASGLRLIIDGVFNHTSDVSVYYNQWMDYRLDGTSASGYDPYQDSCGAWEEVFLNEVDPSWTDCASPYRDWFKVWVGSDTWDVDRDGDYDEPAAHNCGWAGFEFMPDIDYRPPAQADAGPRVWLYGGTNAATPAVASSSVAGMWMADGAALRRGLDGWRLDVPDNAGYFTNTSPSDCSAKVSNDLTIWQGFRTAVDAVGEDKYIVGELWHDVTTGYPVDYAHGVFDGVMNYHYFAMPVSCFITGVGVHNAAGECTGDYAGLTRGSTSSVSSLDAHLATERRRYPAPMVFSSQNLLSSHDTARFASRAGGDLTRLQEAFLLQATLPGAPMIYYGDELGVEGENNELGRAPFPWEALMDTTSDQMAARTYAQRAMCVHNSYSALRTGSFITLAVSDADETWAFARFDARSQVVVAVNNDSAGHAVSLPVWRAGIEDGDTLVDLFSGLTYGVANGSTTVQQVPAGGGVVLVPSSQVSLSAACFPAGPANQPPVADAGDDVNVAVGDVAVLDGSGSRDPDGDPLTYTWTDSDGVVVGTQAVVTVGPFVMGGSYRFNLEVSDGQDRDSDGVYVVVEDPVSCRRSGGVFGGKAGSLFVFGLAGVFMAGVRRRRSSPRPKR